MTRTRTLFYVLASIVAAWCAWYLYSYFDWIAVFAILANAHPAWMGAATASTLAYFVLRALRWRVILADLPGARASRVLDLEFGGAPIKMPVYVLNGAEAGPTVVVTAGTSLPFLLSTASAPSARFTGPLKTTTILVTTDRCGKPSPIVTETTAGGRTVLVV